MEEASTQHPASNLTGLNRAVLRIPPHPSKKLFDRVCGDDAVINLTVGVADFCPPPALHDSLSTLSSRLGEQSLHSYTNSRGLESLRNEIARRYRQRYQLDVDPGSQVLVTNGAADGLWTAIFSLSNPGDEVVVMDPCYMLYEPIILSLDRIPVRVARDPLRGFRLDPDALQRSLSAKTALVILNSPDNPTGVIYDADSLKRVVQVCADRDVFLLHDEVFDDFAYAAEHIPLLAWSTDSKVILVNSLSKRYGMTGWRLGWVIGSDVVIDTMAKIHTYMSLCVGTFVQELATPLINDPTCAEWVRQHSHQTRVKIEKYCDLLRQENRLAFSVPYVQGGFYAFVNVRSFYDKWVPSSRKCSKTVGEDVATYLLEECKIAVVPGISFGPNGADYVRVSLSVPAHILDQAIARLRLFLE